MASDRRKQFLFLNQSLSSGPRSQREKELQDAARRAHAARNSKSKRLLLLTDSDAATSKHRRLKKAPQKSIEGLQHDEAPPARLSKKRHLPVRSRTPRIARDSSELAYEPGPLIPTLRLGQGNHDPFDTASVVGLPPFIYSILDHCESISSERQVKLPLVEVISTPSSVSEIVSSNELVLIIATGFENVWPPINCSDPQTNVQYAAKRKQIIREHSFMLHAYITNASGHNLRLLPPGHPSRTLLTQARSYHERKTFEAISNILSSQTGPAPDGVLLALLFTVFPPGDYDDSVSKYPVSPLAAAQNMNLYVNMEVTPGRIQQIQRFGHLVDTRGGLNGVIKSDWANAAILADTFIASRLGVRPLWRVPTALGYHFEASDDLVLDPHAFQLSLVMGRGFSCLKHSELLRILPRACRATLALDLCHREVRMAPKIWNICKVRMAVQNQLCFLDPPTSLVPSHDDSLYNIGRLAALIYSDLVLFPLGEVVSIKPRLAYDLRKALELLLSGDTVESSEENELIIWCTTMGAIGSYSTVHQEWYVERLTQILREDERLQDWILFQTLMSHYLWWDYVLQPRCQDIWNEAIQMLQPDRSRSLSAETSGATGSGYSSW